MKETADQARTRRRWITLAELVAVAGVLIAALGLWSNWSDRRADQAERAQSAAAEARDKARLDLRGTVASNGRSIALAGDEAHPLGDVRVTFPAALGVAGQDAIDHRIAADWFDAPLLKLTDGGPDERTGRLPVLVTYSYASGDRELTRSAVYDIVWHIEGRFLRGRALRLTDFRLRKAGGTAHRLDAIWAREKPAA